MTLRLHRGGRFRTWLGARFGGDAELGNRVWRRILHALAAAVLVYYLLPEGFFVVVPKWVVLWAALLAVLVLEILRHSVGLELPTLRGYERGRVGSYVFLATAFVLAVTFLPEPIAVAVVLGTAFVDPLAGEVRPYRSLYPALPLAVYAALAFIGLAVVGGWPVVPSVVLALVASGLAVVVERPKLTWLDDDLLMTFVPALALYGIGVVALGL
jgi:hypothetical protein